jgi:hypothetical protein
MYKHILIATEGSVLVGKAIAAGFCAGQGAEVSGDGCYGDRALDCLLVR